MLTPKQQKLYNSIPPETRKALEEKLDAIPIPSPEFIHNQAIQNRINAWFQMFAAQQPNKTPTNKP